MKIAFVIADRKRMTLGACLSSALFFYIYDSESKTTFNLELPDRNSQEQVSTQLTNLLSKEKIERVIGKDFGPKAKAMLEERGIEWQNIETEMQIHDLIKVYKHK